MFDMLTISLCDPLDPFLFEMFMSLYDYELKELLDVGSYACILLGIIHKLGL